MNLLQLITTAFTVSADSFFCGLSLNAQYKNNPKIIIGITAAVFLTCFIGGLAGKSANSFLTDFSEIIGGTILYVVAVFNSVGSKTNSPKLTSAFYSPVFITALVVGFAIGLDGALACFSLTLSGLSLTSVVMLITATHMFMMTLATAIANTNLSKKLARYEFLPPLLLAILGTYKITKFFR